MWESGSGSMDSVSMSRCCSSWSLRDSQVVRLPRVNWVGSGFMSIGFPTYVSLSGVMISYVLCRPRLIMSAWAVSQRGDVYERDLKVSQLTWVCVRDGH